jgi:hypothetical protein
MFPPARGRSALRVVYAVLSTAVLAAAGTVVVGVTAHAQPPPPAPMPMPMHQVKYTVFAEQPFFVDVYYRDTDPPNWADFSHNPYLFSPKVEAQVGPDQQWVMDVMLANPAQWAMVTATSGPTDVGPNIHCVLAVDGVVVATDAGPKGALCSIRSW